MFKKYKSVFLAAFVLNWPWEILHSNLYIHYKGGEITQFILFRAALGDAFMILGLIIIAGLFNKYNTIFLIVIGTMLAIGIEIYALNAGRWEYKSLMPVIPLLGTGLTPTIQLALTGWVAMKVVNYKFFNNA
jgi:hypothetical protein